MSKWTTHKCTICDREDIVPMLHLEGKVPESIATMNDMKQDEIITVSVCFLCMDNFSDTLHALREAVTYEYKKDTDN